MKKWLLSCLLLAPLTLLAQCGWVNGSYVCSQPTQATCRAAATGTIKTPCIAYQGSFTNLGVSGTTGTVNIYTSNAPAGATLLACPNITVTTLGTAGSIYASFNWNTTGGGSIGGLWITTVTMTSGPNNQGMGCYVLSLAGNGSLNFTIATTGATGTPVWETEPVVIRIY